MTDFVISEPNLFTRALTHREHAGISDDQAARLIELNRQYRQAYVPLIKQAHANREELKRRFHKHELAADVEVIRGCIDKASQLLNQINNLFLEHVLKGTEIMTPEQLKLVDQIALAELEGTGQD